MPCTTDYGNKRRWKRNEDCTAGTPFPSNDAECKGYLLHDVDVTMGDAPGTYVYQGTIDWEKVKSLSIADEARTATPRVTFYGAPKIVASQV